MGDPTQNGATPDLVIYRAMRRVIGHVLIDGQRYPVRSPPGTTYAKIQQVFSGGSKATIEETWDAVQSLVPDMPPDVLHDMTIEELRDIVAYALNPVRAVEARAKAETERLAPKGEGTEPLAPSSPPTSTDTSAIGSPPPLGVPSGTS